VTTAGRLQHDALNHESFTTAFAFDYVLYYYTVRVLFITRMEQFEIAADKL